MEKEETETTSGQESPTVIKESRLGKPTYVPQEHFLRNTDNVIRLVAGLNVEFVFREMHL